MITNKRVRTELANRIENHMAAKGIKRKELIEALGMGYQAFERRMRGDIEFGLGEVWVIAKILRTSPLALMPEDVAEVHAHAA